MGLHKSLSSILNLEGELDDSFGLFPVSGDARGNLGGRQFILLPGRASVARIDPWF